MSIQNLNKKVIQFNLSAITIVELLITVTILTILATIGFIAFQSYSQDARNSVRLTDVKNINRVLELFHVNSNFYPEPTDYVNILYNGSPLWLQGSFGDTTRQTVTKMTSTPVDPLNGTPYTYSVTIDKTEYELGYAMEGVEFIDTEDLMFKQTKVYAGVDDFITGVSGNYNGKIQITSTGGLDYILAIPSIIATDTSDAEVTNIIRNKKLTFKGYANLPSTYGLTTDNSNLFDLSSKDIVVFSGHLSDLNSEASRMVFYRNLNQFYSDSQLRFKKGYDDFSSVYADEFNPTQDFVDTSCRVTRDMVGAERDEFKNLVCGDEQLAFTGTTLSGALLYDSGAVSRFGNSLAYIGQWPLGSVAFNQPIQTANHDRNTLGLTGSLNNPIGTKWKIFTSGRSPDLVWGGYDIDGNGNEDLLYGYGGKLFLGDTITTGTIWESKILDIRAILGVESILADGSKSIIVALGDDWYIGVINGKTGVLEWISNQVTGPVKTVKPGWPSIDYKVFDVNSDGIKEYHFKQRYTKYNSMRFFAQGGKVVGETLWSSEGYGDYNSGSDGYQPSNWTMGNINGRSVVGTKGSNTFAFYDNAVNSSLSGIDKFKMPAFGKFNVGGNSWNGWNAGILYFYDLNGDGNDEFVSQITEELNNNKLSRIFVSGFDSGQMKQYMSLSNPRVVDGAGNLTSYGNFYTPIPLKNTINPEDSYIMTYGKDPNNLSSSRWMMLKYKGLGNTGFKQNSLENESFNHDIVYDKFDTSYEVSGIFNNGNKDYIVLTKGGEFYFYTFTGVDSFLTPSTLKLRGGFYGNTMFDGGYDIRYEKNKNSGKFLAGVDTDGNGLKEFVVTDGGYFKFYEITDSGVILKKSYGPYNSIGGVLKRQITSDLQDIYGITYNSTANVVDYYRTSSANGSYFFTKRTNNSFYSGGQTRDLLISRLGAGSDRYNKLMIQYVGMYDARNASPANPPVRIGNDFYYSYDMDGDGNNEVFIGGKAYTYNSPGNHTLKYNYTGWAGDFNGDGVLDQARGYCGAVPLYPYNIFYTIRSGIDGSQLAPDLDWGNGNGRCSAGDSYSNVSEDFDGDGIDELVAGNNARYTRIISINSGTVTEGNQLATYSENMPLIAFDFDGDGKKEISRGTDNAGIMRGNPSNKTQLSTLVNIPGDVKSTCHISGGMPSFYRKNGITYAAFRGLDGQVSLKSWNGTSITNNFNSYYLNAKRYLNSDSVLNDKLMPLPTADVLLGDFIGDGTVQVLVGGGDGYIYILSTSGSIRKAYNIGSAIKKIIFGDVNEDGVLDVIVSAEDGYIYQISSSLLLPPSVIRDGQNIGRDAVYQSDSKSSGLHFTKTAGALGYMVQLYNASKKIIVFDWVNIGDISSACISSSDTTVSGCLKTTKSFNLIPGDMYQWRVQSYDNEKASPISLSNGFIIR